MKVHFIILLFLFFMQTVSGQNFLQRKVHQKIQADGTWENYKATDYFYDERGNIIEELQLDYDTLSRDWVPL